MYVPMHGIVSVQHKGRSFPGCLSVDCVAVMESCKNYKW